MKIKIVPALVVLLTGMIGLAFVMVDQDTKPWPVPDNYKAMKNTVTFDKSSAAALYSTHCKSCHGKEGLGDGTKAAQLNTPCGDFTTAEFAKQSDGALYYKVAEGREDMPSFKKKIPDTDDIWQVVHYMRYLNEQ